VRRVKGEEAGKREYIDNLGGAEYFYTRIILEIMRRL
jgi:hypothetical protein